MSTFSLNIPNTNKEDLLVGEERYTASTFFRKYNLYKEGQINNKVPSIPEGIQLPMNSCIHLIDNIYKESRNLPTLDTPDLNIPFIKNEPFKKFIHHVSDFNTSDKNNPVYIEDKYVFLKKDMPQILRKYQASTLRFMKTVPLESLNKNPSTLNMVNYNPLFRMFMRGILSNHRRMQLILGTLVNTISKIEDKVHYVLFPLGEKVFPRSSFLLCKKEFTVNSIKHRDDIDYLLMMHWINFTDATAGKEQSIFNYIPEDKLASINFIFYFGSKFVLYNLADIVRMNKDSKNKIYGRLINQYNSVVLSGMNKETPEDPDVEVNVTIDVQKEEDDPEDIASTIQTKDLIKGFTKSKVPDKFEDFSEDEYSDDFDEFDYGEMDDFDDFNDSKIDLVEDTPRLIKPVEIVNEVTTEEVVKSNTSKVEDRFGELSKLTPIATPDDVAKIGVKFMENVDALGVEAVLKDDSLTAKQKERMAKYATAYKDITINGVDLESILSGAVDPKINDSSIDTLNDFLIDKSMSKSNIIKLDKEYMDKFYLKDLVSTAISMNRQGMFLVDIKQEMKITQLNRVIDYRFSYMDTAGKKHSINFTLPHVAEDGTILVNGVKSYMRKQMVNLPICKVSPERVSLASNFNKTIVERSNQKAHSFLPYIQRFLAKVSTDKNTKLHIDFQSLSLNERISYEYSELASMYSDIEIVNIKGESIKLDFKYDNRFTNIPEKDRKSTLDLEKKYGVYFGNFNSEYALFMDIKNKVNMVPKQGSKLTLQSTSLLKLLNRISGVKLSSQLTEWADIKILDKKLPVGFLLCFQFGFRHILEYLGCEFHIVPKKLKAQVASEELLLGEEAVKPQPKYIPSPDDIAIKFKDATCYINRYPLRNSLIMTGMTKFDTKNYFMEELNTKDAYYRLLIDAGYKTNYLKGIEDTFAQFIDSMTFDVLVQLGEPTTFKDLLIRAVDMITTSEHRPASSMANHRFRTYERFNAIVYNEMTRQFATFNRRKGSGSIFSLNPNSVFLRVIQDQSVTNVEDINPIHDIKTTTGFTYTGMGGRSQESFVVNDRIFPKDGMGIMSEATVDSGSVGIVAQATIDPNITNVRGLVNTSDRAIEPTNILSVTGVLMPSATQDD